jgi:hypothetical protein
MSVLNQAYWLTKNGPPFDKAITIGIAHNQTKTNRILNASPL